jgi:hypothetical protein
MKLPLLATLAFVLAASAWAGESDRFALVVGNAAYQGEAALAHPTTDASDVADLLKSIGWKVKLVLDGDRRALNSAVTAFRDELAGAEAPTALLYYAGHGVQIDGQNYLIPVGGTFQSADDVVHDAVSLASVQAAFDTGRAATQIFILDACRDNPFVKKASRSLGGSRGLSVVNKSSVVEGSAVLFATAPGETAADGTGRNGVFTQALLKYLGTDLKLQDVVTKVTGEVKKLTGGAQVPYNSLSLSDDFYMVPASLRKPVAPPATVVGNGQPFTLTVKGPVEGMTVLIDGAEVGKTPYQAQYAVGKTMMVQLSHPDFLPYRIVVDPTGLTNVVVDPKVGHTTQYEFAALRTKKDELTSTRSRLKDAGGWTTWTWWGGWAGTAVGAGLAGFAAWSASDAVSAYHAASQPVSVDQARMDAARAQGQGANLLFRVGIGVGLAGLAAAGAGWLLAPDTRTVDDQLREVEHQIQLLGGS